MTEERKSGRVIRPVDGYESGESAIWISLTDEIEDIGVDAETLSKLLPPVLSKYDVFNMTITTTGGKGYWTWLPVLETGVPVESVPWVDELPAVEENRAFLPPWGALFRVALSVSPKDSSGKQRGRLTVYASHAICDGRTLESLHRVVRSAVPGQPGTADLPNQGLCAFGQAANFTLPPEAYSSAPASWDFKLGRMIPDFAAEHYVEVYSDYDNTPIRSYCRKHGVSTQGVMMAIMERAYRAYNKAPDDAPIYSNYMIDSRHHAAATAEFRTTKFFCGAASGFPVVFGQGKGIGADIAHCTQRMREDFATNDGVVQTVRIARCINPDTLEYTPLTGSPFPDYGKMPITVSTNIGRFNSCAKPRVGVHIKCIPTSYFVILYGYSTHERMYFLTLRPRNLDPVFAKTIEDEINAVMKYVSEN